MLFGLTALSLTHVPRTFHKIVSSTNLCTLQFLIKIMTYTFRVQIELYEQRQNNYKQNENLFVIIGSPSFNSPSTWATGATPVIDSSFRSGTI